MRWTTPAMVPVAPGSCRTDSIQWVAPDDRRDRTRLDAWCAGVGVATYHERVANGASETVALPDITFVSWNVHVGNGDVRAFVADLRKGEHTRGRRVRHFVLMLQEAV